MEKLLKNIILLFTKIPEIGLVGKILNVPFWFQTNPLLSIINMIKFDQSTYLAKKKNPVV